MALKDELTAQVRRIFRESWKVRDGQKVPDVKDLVLGSNDAVKIEATVLYADMSDSTKLVDNYNWEFAAEVYKSYLHCASEIIRSENGVITAYDGDRVMAVFFDGSKNSNAVRSAMKIKWAVQEIINPAIRGQYPSKQYELRQVVGIDTSELRVARTGVWGANDLVWVGRAANYAAKLSNINEAGYYTIITETVYNCMLKDTRISGDGRNMWERRSYAIGSVPTLRSSWGWVVN